MNAYFTGFDRAAFDKLVKQLGGEPPIAARNHLGEAIYATAPNFAFRFTPEDSLVCVTPFVHVSTDGLRRSHTS